MAPPFARSFGDVPQVTGAAPALAVFDFDGEHDTQYDNGADDLTGNGYHLYREQGSNHGYETVGKVTGRKFDNSDRLLSILNDEAIRVTGALTVEILVKALNDDNNTGHLVVCASDGESPSNNYLYQFAHAGGAGGLNYFHESGNGVNHGGGFGANIDFGTIELLTFTRAADGRTYKLYRNGVQVGSTLVAGAAPTKAGGGNTQRLAVGLKWQSSTSGNDFLGTIFTIRITPDEFSPAQALQGYNQLLEVMEVTQTGDLELTADFDVDLDLSGASGDAVRDPASWSLETDEVGAVPGAEIVGVEVVSDSRLRFTLSDYSTDAKQRKVTVLGAVFLVDLTDMQGTEVTYDSVVSRPRVTSAVATSAKSIDVTFDRDLRRNQELFDVAKYVLSGGLSTSLVTRTSPRSVTLDLAAGMTPGVVYTLSVLDT